MRLDEVRMIAKKAGDAIMRVYSRDFGVERKADNSPLTEADMAAHQVIVDGLAACDPGTPVLSEEGAEHASYAVRRGWDRYWLVDPLDGTREFVKRNGQFTVNIARVERGRAVAGVVYAPAREWMYWGSVGGGAFKSVEDADPVPIRCQLPPQSGRLRVVGSLSHRSPESSAYIEALRSRYSEISLVSMGSSLKICMVAEGIADLYPRLAPTMEWDTAAAHAVLAAAGGRLWDYRSGEELRYSKADLRNNWFVAGAAGVEELVPVAAAGA